MSERDFIYWLQGYLEMSEAKALDEKQVQTIKDHIKQAVVKVTPDRFINQLTVPRISDTIIC